MLEFLQSCRSVYPACRGVAADHGGSGRCSRDEISPRPHGRSQPPELRAHHGAKPGVDTPKTRQGKDSCRLSPIRTQGLLDNVRQAWSSTPPHPCRPLVAWRTSQSDFGRCCRNSAMSGGGNGQ
ncbi:hypothetical protein BSZ07_08215 [Streptomyces sp. M1013]|nr:hypothetical protein BSZ07_08215 [Streptomyces sp. M1013]